jgi:hypothetical protein
MKSIAVLLVGVLLFGSAACADSVVGTDDSVTAESSPVLKKKPPPVPQDPSEWPVTLTFADREGDQIRSDAELRTDLTDFSYVDGECGVMAEIGNLDDVRFDPDWSYKRKDARTCGEARVLVFEFDDGRPDNYSGAFLNINGLCAMGVGETRDTTYAQFNVGQPLAFDDLRAERTDAATWVVSTDGDSGDLAIKGDGSTHTMPFALTITSLDPDACP